MSTETKGKPKCTRFKIVAIILAAIAVTLGIASFLMPPQGIIDGSVIGFTGEIFALISLFFAWESVERGIDAKITHKGTEIEINNPDNK